MQVLEGRRLFQHLTTEENLLTGALIHPNHGRKLNVLWRRCMSISRRWLKLRNRTAGYLSGGEQQMVAIGRALMARPRLMLLDEPSLGLAPLLVQAIFEMIRKYNEESGVSILLVEQNANVALQAADYAYVMENGRIVLDGPADQLAQNADIKEFYLGLTRWANAKATGT